MTSPIATVSDESSSASPQQEILFATHGTCAVYKATKTAPFLRGYAAKIPPPGVPTPENEYSDSLLFGDVLEDVLILRRRNCSTAREMDTACIVERVPTLPILCVPMPVRHVMIGTEEVIEAAEKARSELANAIARNPSAVEMEFAKKLVRKYLHHEGMKRPNAKDFDKGVDEIPAGTGIRDLALRAYVSTHFVWKRYDPVETATRRVRALETKVARIRDRIRKHNESPYANAAEPDMRFDRASGEFIAVDNEAELAEANEELQLWTREAKNLANAKQEPIIYLADRDIFKPEGAPHPYEAFFKTARIEPASDVVPVIDRQQAPGAFRVTLTDVRPSVAIFIMCELMAGGSGGDMGTVAHVADWVKKEFKHRAAETSQDADKPVRDSCIRGLTSRLGHFCKPSTFTALFGFSDAIKKCQLQLSASKKLIVPCVLAFTPGFAPKRGDILGYLAEAAVRCMAAPFGIQEMRVVVQRAHSDASSSSSETSNNEQQRIIDEKTFLRFMHSIGLERFPCTSSGNSATPLPRSALHWASYTAALLHWHGVEQLRQSDGRYIRFSPGDMKPDGRGSHVIHAARELQPLPIPTAKLKSVQLALQAWEDFLGIRKEELCVLWTTAVRCKVLWGPEGQRPDSPNLAGRLETVSVVTHAFDAALMNADAKKRAADRASRQTSAIKRKEKALREAATIHCLTHNDSGAKHDIVTIAPVTKYFESASKRPKITEETADAAAATTTELSGSVQPL
jgi:hypothetical protein